MSEAINSKVFVEEMKGMILCAKESLLAMKASVEIYSVSIWTDPGPRLSAISIDTEKHSSEMVRVHNEWVRAEREEFRSRGDMEMAKLFREAKRNTNPEDFAFPRLALCSNKSIDLEFDLGNSGAMWNELGPLLEEVQSIAFREFWDMRRHSEAEIAINAINSWYFNPLRWSD